ncbi:hypothetical protein RHMOL_Rhmol03G0018500 [Rhododendron molle]|uniref:Uncharacterized protein n=1 Tax=Rhododendron molle TaxID=49168 RepID=A0ACC0P9X2_RHOML|nr:hypothetical protein RHMOL_Rhmol03G0018500 [Rhododendron molle]
MENNPSMKSWNRALPPCRYTREKVIDTNTPTDANTDIVAEPSVLEPDSDPRCSPSPDNCRLPFAFARNENSTGALEFKSLAILSETHVLKLALNRGKMALAFFSQTVSS